MFVPTFKRISAFAAAFAMLLGMVWTFSAVPANAVVLPSATVAADKEEADRGETVEVTVGIKNYTPIAGAKATLTYDNAVLKLNENGVALLEDTDFEIISFSDSEGEISATVIGTGNVETDNSGIALFKATFTVLDGAAFGETVLSAALAEAGAWNEQASDYVFIDLDTAADSAALTVACKHTFGEWENAGDNHKRICTKCGDIDFEDHTAGEAVKENEIWNCTVSYEYDSVVYCSVCGKEMSRGKVVEGAPGHEWGAWNPETASRACIHCGETETMVFTDVPVDSWYADAVIWAVKNKITNGTSETTFSPNDSCTRAQVVMFLWNAAGKPAPKTAKNPFTDVKSTDWFYEAVLWAVENGITSGTSETTFSPGMTCTRAQVVTFLWNAAGNPAPKNTVNPFTDVPYGAWFYNAVLWAVENKVTNGTAATTFAPGAICTRAQVVMFIQNDAMRGVS